MRDAPHHPQPEFYGYVYFDDPDWWRTFTVTETCALAIQDFRQAVLSLTSGDEEEVSAYEATIRVLWEASERVVNRMQWHARKDIAVIVALAELYEECVDRIEPMSFDVERIRDSLDIKAMSIRSLLSTLHDVRGCRQ